MERITRLVEQQADCFERTCRPGHLTASAWVMSPDGERALLLRHRKLGRWLQPGGHCDGDGDLAAVALREAQEETGLGGLRIISAADGLAPLDVDVHPIPARFDASGAVIEDAHEHHDVRFLLIADGGTDPRSNEESLGVRWCSAAEVATLTLEESVLRLQRKAAARLSQRP